LPKVSHESNTINKRIPDIITLRELQGLTDIPGNKFKVIKKIIYEYKYLNKINIV